MLKLLKIATLIGIAMLFLGANMLAQSDTLWTRTFGGSSGDGGRSVYQTNNGGYIITGYTNSYGAGSSDVWLIKTNASGDTEWTRTFGGSSNDMGYSVRQTSDGGYIITGYTKSYGAGSSDVWLINTNSSGDTLWTKTYGGGGYDYGKSVQQTSDGGYIIVGRTESFGPGYRANIYLIKTNPSGDTLWTKAYGGSNVNSGEDGFSVQQTTDGGYIITGYTNFGTGGHDVWLLKTDSLGDTLWTRNLGRGIGYSVQQTTDGGYIITGNTGFDVLLIKTDELGDTIWTKTYVEPWPGTHTNIGYSVQQTTNGGYIIAGIYAFDGYLINTNSLGDTIWTNEFGGTGDDVCYSVQQTNNGGYIIAGRTRSYGAGDYDIWLIKTDSLGNVPIITLYSPNGSESYQGRSNINITWKTNTTPWAINWQANTCPGIDHIRLLYSINSGSTYTDTISHNLGNTGSYIWNVPFFNSTAIRVKAQALSASYFLFAEDASNTDFEIYAFINPTNGSHISSNPTFEWANVQDALYYHLVVANDPSFSNIIWSQSAIPGDQTSITYNGSTFLETGQTYYWKMQYQHTDLSWSNWTNAWSFTKDAGVNPLAAPNINTPSNGSSITFPETFSWSSVSGAQRYVVEIASDVSFSNILWQAQSNVNWIQVPGGISGISDGGTYYWRVAAIDVGGNIGNYSDVRNFVKLSTVSPPSAPTLLEPASGDTVRSQTVTFSWTCPEATSYILRYSVSPSFPSASDSTWTVPGITDTTYSVNLPPDAAIIYWKLKGSNSGGESGWSGAISFNYQPDVGLVVTSVVIDRPNNGFTIEGGSNFTAHARLTGTYNGTVVGGWYLNDTLFASFTAEMTAANGAEVISPMLPTSTASTDTLQVRITSPNVINSNEVIYSVSSVSFGTAAKIQLYTNPSTIPADSSSQALITASVLDSLGRLVSDDSGRIIQFSISGPGWLSSSSAPDTNGQVHITLTSSTSAGTITITAKSTGLDSAIASLITFTSPLQKLRDQSTYYVNRLDSLMVYFETDLPWISNSYLLNKSYNVENARTFIQSTSDTTALKRLILSLKAIDRMYHHNPSRNRFDMDQTIVPGATQMVDNASLNMAKIVLLSYGCIEYAKVGLSKVSTSKLWKKALEKTFKMISDCANWAIEQGIAMLPERYEYTLQETRKTMFLVINNNIDSKSLPELLASDLVRSAGDEVLLRRYINDTQTSLDQAVSYAESGTVSNDYNSANAEVWALINNVTTETRSVDLEVTAIMDMGEFMETLGDFGNIVSHVAPSNIFSLTWTLNSYAWALSGYGSSIYHSIKVLNNIPEYVEDAVNASFGQSGGVQSLGPLLLAKRASLNSPNVGLYRQLADAMSSNSETYEQLVRRIANAISSDDTTLVLSLLDQLYSSDEDFSKSMDLAKSPLLAGGYNALLSIPEFSTSYDSTFMSINNSEIERTYLLLSLVKYLEYPSDPQVKQEAVDRANIVLQSNNLALDNVHSTVTDLFTTPASPLVLIKDYSIPDSISVGQTFTVSATLMNTGSGTAQSVYVKLIPGDSFVTVTNDSLYVGDLESGSEYSVSWQLVPTSAVVDTLSHTWSIMTLSPYTGNGLSLNKSLIANIYKATGAFSSTFTQAVNGSDTTTITFGDTNVKMSFSYGPSGVVTVDKYNTSPPGSGINVLPIYWDISSNLSDFLVTLTFSYTDQEIGNSGLDENFIILAYYNGSSWVPVSTQTDVENNRLSTLTNHFSLWGTGYESSVPVTLSSFTARQENGVVILEWVTESEVENMGFILERRESIIDSSFTKWLEIASYITHPELQGQGSVTHQTEYRFVDSTVVAGVTYDYRLADVNYDGVFEYHGFTSLTVELYVDIPEEYTLYQNYPNPFNPITNFKYGIPEPSHVTIKIYNIMGQQVVTLVNEEKLAGYHHIKWDASDVGSGVYFYHLKANGFSQVKKCLVIK